MLSHQEKGITYFSSQCQQCGTCEAICSKQAISLLRMKNGLVEVVIDDDKCIRCKKCVSVCPAVRQNEKSDYFAEIPLKHYFLGYNKNNAIRHDASSGGVCKTLMIEALKAGLVDGVYSLHKREEYPQAEGEFYTRENIPTFDCVPNSVYHSVLLGRNIHKVQKCNRLMIVGTSCQLRALEIALRGKYQTLIKICIFCKQQKSIDSTRFLAKAMGTSLPNNFKISTRYRGKGWPGIVRVMGAELPWNRAAQLPFGRRLWSVPGCNVCGDPFGIETNADITLMDPWKIREANDLGETLITVHTSEGMELLKNISAISLEENSFADIEPALDLADIRRKRQLVAFFRGENVDKRIKWAGKAEQFQRKLLQNIAMKLPRMPFIFYRIMCKFPDLRNIILK